jgi:hypothetical protein
MSRIGPCRDESLGLKGWLQRRLRGGGWIDFLLLWGGSRRRFRRPLADRGWGEKR